MSRMVSVIRGANIVLNVTRRPHDIEQSAFFRTETVQRRNKYDSAGVGAHGDYKNW